MTAKFRLRSLLPLVCSLAASEQVFADNRMLEEVVVSAQKRETNLQDTPISVAAFNSEALQKAGISGLGEIAQRAPGLAIGELNAGQPQIYIRGIGSNEEGPGGDASVVVYVDEVYMGRASGANTELFDLQRVEVLRGPQGTLFGKNASGGAINIVTKTPSDDFTAAVRAGAGNLGASQFDAYASGPLSDSMAASIAYTNSQRDGYLENVITGNDLADKDTNAVRTKLRWDINEQLSAIVSADYTRDNGLGVGRKPRGAVADSFANVSPFDQTVGEHHKVASIIDGKQDREIWGSSLKFSWSGDNVELVSITAYRDNSWAEDSEFIGIPMTAQSPLILSNFVVEESSQFSQEFRLSGNGDALTHWVVGAFYSTEDNDRIEDFQVFTLPIDHTRVQADVTSYALFGEFTWAIQDNLDLTVGARYSRDEKDITARGIASVLVDEDFDIAAGDSWSEPTFKAVLSYRPTDTTMVYGSITSGYKSGGFQGQPDSALIASTPFRPETALSYEIGAKLDLLDSTLRTNFSIFRSEFDDYQELLTLEVGGFPVTVTQNAAEVLSQGIEFDITWLPIDNLMLTASGAYLDSQYDAYLQDASVVGNATRNAPRISYALSASYTVPLQADSELEFRADYRHKDEAFQDPQNRDYSSIPEYDLIDASIIYAINSQLSVTLWGKNLADEEYLVHSFALSGLRTAPSISGLPRTYGISVMKEF